MEDSLVININVDSDDEEFSMEIDDWNKENEKNIETELLDQMMNEDKQVYTQRMNEVTKCYSNQCTERTSRSTIMSSELDIKIHQLRESLQMYHINQPKIYFPLYFERIDVQCCKWLEIPYQIFNPNIRSIIQSLGCSWIYNDDPYADTKTWIDELNAKILQKDKRCSVLTTLTKSNFANPKKRMMINKIPSQSIFFHILISVYVNLDKQRIIKLSPNTQTTPQAKKGITGIALAYMEYNPLWKTDTIRLVDFANIKMSCCKSNRAYGRFIDLLQMPSETILYHAKPNSEEELFWYSNLFPFSPILQYATSQKRMVNLYHIFKFADMNKQHSDICISKHTHVNICIHCRMISFLMQISGPNEAIVRDNSDIIYRKHPTFHSKNRMISIAKNFPSVIVDLVKCGNENTSYIEFHEGVYRQDNYRWIPRLRRYSNSNTKQIKKVPITPQFMLEKIEKICENCSA